MLIVPEYLHFRFDNTHLVPPIEWTSEAAKKLYDAGVRAENDPGIPAFKRGVVAVAAQPVHPTISPCGTHPEIALANARHQIARLCAARDNEGAEHYTTMLLSMAREISPLLANENSPVWRVGRSAFDVIGASVFGRPSAAFQSRRDRQGIEESLRADVLGQKVGVLTQAIT